MEKFCHSCQQLKSTDEFYKNSTTKDGLSTACKVCKKEHGRAYRAANKERIKETKRAYNSANKEIKRETKRAYRAANKEKIREYSRAYYVANPEKVKEAIRAYRAANKEKRKEQAHNYYVANKEKAKETKRAYRAANKEKIREQDRAYSAANKEKHKEQARTYYVTNKEKIKEQGERWRKSNPATWVLYQQKRRTRKALTGGDYTLEEWERLCDYFGNKCLACGQEEPLTVDHIIPLSKGGSNDISNLQPLCKPCNSTKHTAIVDYRPSIPDWVIASMP